MKSCTVKFRDFGKVKVNFSYYVSGSVKIEVFAFDDLRLCELSYENKIINNMPSDIVIIKKTPYADEFVNIFVKEGIIRRCIPMSIGNVAVYLCMLDRKVMPESNINQYRTAAVGAC